MARRKDRSNYQPTADGDVQLLVSKDLAGQIQNIDVNVHRYLLFFRQLQADVELRNGVQIGRGAHKVPH